jgi:hypothetical protein
VKVTIDGEVFDFDPVRKPLVEALALEAGLKIPYAQYEEGLREGRALSVVGFIWLVWRRNGRDVPLADILSGAVAVDLDALEVDEEGEADPTTPPPPASPTTGDATSAPSRKSSTSGRGSSGS